MSDVTENSLIVVGGNGKEPARRGRPPAEEPCTSVSTWLPATYHDRLIQLANQHEKSVSALVREMLMLRLNR